MAATTEVFLAGTGPATDVRTQSGRPYFLLEAAQEIGDQRWRDLGLDAGDAHWTARRYAWNGAGLVLGRGSGGYQYSEAFLDRFWSRSGPRLSGHHVINWTQVYSRSLIHDDSILKSFYIDQTLEQLFSGYGVRTAIRHDVADEAIRLERLGYSRAHAIITTSRWARDGVLAACPDAQGKVHVVLSGANLPLAQYRQWAATHSPRLRRSGQPLRLLFVGANPIRKGLDRLLRAVVLARQAGASIEVTVIGATRDGVDEALREIPRVQWVGRLDKIRDIDRFLAIAADHDVGCLLSRAEASAVSLREYQAVGLAVVGPNVGGCPEFVIPGAGELVGSDESDEAIARLLVKLERDRSKVEAMRVTAWNSRESLLWPRAVERISRILSIPKDGSEDCDSD